MMQHIVDAKIIATAGTGVAGILAQAAIPEGADWLKRISELGSFGLVAFAVYMSFTKLIPLFVTFLEKRDAAFVQALKDERDAASKINTDTRNELREIVSAQTTALSNKLDELKTVVKTTGEQ